MQTNSQHDHNTNLGSNAYQNPMQVFNPQIIQISNRNNEFFNNANQSNLNLKSNNLNIKDDREYYDRTYNSNNYNQNQVYYVNPNNKMGNPNSNRSDDFLKSAPEFPKLRHAQAVCLLVTNILLPGIGTMVLGCYSNNCCKYFLFGILQFLLTLIIVGYIWAIFTSIQALKNVQKHGQF